MFRMTVPTDTPTSALSLSFFKNAQDNQPKPLAATWTELATSLADVRAATCTPETCKRAECPDKHGEAWSPASYTEGSPRRMTGVVAVSALVLDIDHVDSDEKLAQYIDKVPYQKIVHASHSDRPGDRCARLIVQLSRPVLASEWSTFWTTAVSVFEIPTSTKTHGGVDPATKDATRIYFLPSRPQGTTETLQGDGTDYLFATIDGPPLDVDTVLALAEANTHVGTVLASSTSSTTDARTVPSSTGRQGALETLAANWPQKGRHQASLALAGALAHARWTSEQVAEFMHELMDMVYGAGMDPSAGKRDQQARDSVAKVERGEPVQGWPSLIPHVGDIAVASTTKALGIGGKPAWVQSFLDKHGKPQKPTADSIRAQFKAIRKRLLRQQKTLSQQEAIVLGKVLDYEQIVTAQEDPTETLVFTIRTLTKYAPEADPDQLAQTLIHVHPIDVGQGDMPWPDTLIRLVEQCREALAEEALQEGEFAMETAGLRVGKPKQTPDNLATALKKLKTTIRYDEFAERALIRRAPELPEEILEDHHVNALRIDIERAYEFKLSKDDSHDVLDYIARSNSFHPVRDYLDASEWDRTFRIGDDNTPSWLTTYCGAEDTPYTRVVGRLVLLAAVRRIRKPGTKFDQMLILEGEQGISKSTALLKLVPEPQWFTDDIPLNADTKVIMEHTKGKWIVEAGELKGKSKSDEAQLKSFLSRMVDSAREAYGRKSHYVPRQYIIIGTTNDEHYLKDMTGDRRYWPIKVFFIDLDALVRDRDQLWAEAAYFEALGESIMLDPSLYKTAAVEQEKRRVVDNIEVILTEALEDLEGRLKCLDVWSLFGKDPLDAKLAEQTKANEVMRKLGWTRVRRRVGGKPVWCYLKGDDTPLVVNGRKVLKAGGVQTPSYPDVPIKPN